MSILQEPPYEILKSHGANRVLQASLMVLSYLLGVSHKGGPFPLFVLLEEWLEAHPKKGDPDLRAKFTAQMGELRALQTTAEEVAVEPMTAEEVAVEPISHE